MMEKLTLAELLEAAALANAPQRIAESRVRLGGVDPLGLRQINFRLMDQVFPSINNVARHIRPYILMTWAWRRVAWIIERDRAAGADDLVMRDFVDRVEAIYAWSQFMLDRRADIPGGQALSPLLILDEPYRFHGEAWEQRRRVRRYSTGLISPLNYGPSLKSLGWLLPVEGADGAFAPSSALDPALDAFEALMGDELEHDAFSRFGPVEVALEDVERWAPLWSLTKPTARERAVALKLLAGDAADPARQSGVLLVRAAYRELEDSDAETADVRWQMAALPDEWGDGEQVAAAAAIWRRVQVRQVFRLALESLFHWMIGELERGPLSSETLAGRFLDEAREGRRARLPVNAGTWIALGKAPGNPVEHLTALREALQDSGEKTLARAIVEALGHAIAEAPEKAEAFEMPDRLPLARAKSEFAKWSVLTPKAFLINVIERWVLAQHAYWCVGRGMADARRRGKNILRLRIVMDEGGWTLTPGTGQGNPPEATPDRLETILSLLAECRRLP